MIGPRAMSFILEALDESALVAFRRTIDTELDRRAGRPVEERKVRREFEKHLLQAGVGEELDVCGCEAHGMSRLRAAISAMQYTGTLFPFTLDENFVRDRYGQPLSLVEMINNLLEAFDRGGLDVEVLNKFRRFLRRAHELPVNIPRDTWPDRIVRDRVAPSRLGNKSCPIDRSASSD
jgi:hypothetical protein